MWGVHFSRRLIWIRFGDRTFTFSRLPLSISEAYGRTKYRKLVFGWRFIYTLDRHNDDLHMF